MGGLPPQPHPQQVLTGPPPVADECVILIGQPPLNEYLGYMSQTLEGQVSDRRQLMDRWRAANDHIHALEQSEAGLADNAPATGLPELMAERAEALLADPAVDGAYQTVPTEVAMVELDRLVVFQKHIKLSYVEQLSQLVPEDATAEQIFDFALPTDGRYDPQPQAAPLAQNAWCFTSLSNDLRVLDVQLVDPRAVAGITVRGRPAAMLTVIIGYSANLLSAIRIDGRLVLNNGSHRAYALRAAGHTHAPCLIENASRREELDLLVSPEVLNNLELYVKAPRPPLFKDYFDDRLRMGVHMPRTRRQVQAAINHQAVDLPGA